MRLASVLNAELKSPCQNFISGKTETFTVDTAKLVRINIIVNTTKKNRAVLRERYRSRNTEWKRKWREDPVNREKHNKSSREWLKRNRQYSNAKGAKKRAAKLQATPAWADLKKIEEIYKNCPPGYHVDHYFPLKSPIMCGLHTELNLQYLPAKENIRKKNNVTLEQQLNG